MGRIGKPMLRHRVAQDFLEKHPARSLGPSLGHTISKYGVTHKNQAWLAILHHAGEFRGRLSRVQWHANYSLGHERQVESRPADGIGREKGATVPGLDAGVSKEQTNKLNLVQQFPAGHADKAIATNFAKNDAAIRAL